MRSQSEGAGAPETPIDPDTLDTINRALLDMRTATSPAQATARWWGNVIVNPNFDNGADDPSNVMAQDIAAMGHEHLRADIEQHVGAFVIALELAISIGQERGDRCAREIYTDYHPDPVLVLAAKAAGMDERRVDMFVFPWKSYTRVQRDGTVVARMGYGQEAKQIWPPEGMTPEDMAQVAAVAVTAEPAPQQPALAAPAPKTSPVRRALNTVVRLFGRR